MKTGAMNIAVSFLLLAACTGCKTIPCYPPEHYAPGPGAHYSAEEIRVQTAKGHTLAGTLTIPLEKAPPYPAVLLITGSSPQERDHTGTQKVPIRYYKPFRQIADRLSGNGIAVLRMDDQGVGCSEGGPPENITIPERADDSRAAIEFLRSRKHIDKTRIGLLGLSEGGNIGPLIAASDATIRAVVVMAGSATNGYRIIEYQRRIKISEKENLTKAAAEQKLAESMQGLKQAIKRGEGSPWFNSFLEYRPLAAARKVSCPVLILHGDKDSHVPVAHAALLAQAMRGNGNKNVTLKIFRNHNHLFLKDPDGRMSGYLDLLRHTHNLSNEVLATIDEWFTDQFTGEKSN